MHDGNRPHHDLYIKKKKKKKNKGPGISRRTCRRCAGWRFSLRVEGLCLERYDNPVAEAPAHGGSCTPHGVFIAPCIDSVAAGSCGPRRTSVAGAFFFFFFFFFFFTQRHRGLPRRRPEPRHAGDERFRRGRSIVVAQPSGAPPRSCSPGPPTSAPGPRTFLRRAGARSAVAALGLGRSEHRRSTETPVIVLEPRDGNT